jgi:hypothetical protein
MSQSALLKLVVFVPETDADAVRTAMGEAGAGHLGDYGFCSFSQKGIGRFKPLDGANPAIGDVAELEAVEEERIETWCTREQLQAVIAAIKQVHPYEEVPIDVYPLESLE